MDKKFLIGYIFSAVLLLLFSYTQVDLSLTLSKLSVLQTIEKSFQYIGFYQRPLSTGIFIFLVLLFFFLYYEALRASSTIKHLRVIVASIVLILIISYPAFSYDIFNYMFDAKTILVYNKIPYFVSPLQFTGIEPWLSFMRWTHIPSAYMPFWILLTLPVYLLGFGHFLTILWSFKMLAAVSYLFATWCIWKILLKLDHKKARYGVILFALNPLIIFESLVSGHNDIVMVAFALFSFFLYIQKKRVFSFIFLSFSVATKVMTGALIPIFLIGWQRSWSILAMITGLLVFIFITKREILPWYMIWLVPWVALLPRITWLSIISFGVTLGFVLSYSPVLYFGDYNPPVGLLKFWIVVIPTVLSVVVALFYRSFAESKLPQV